eukprot:EG_transcript_18389
MVDHSEPEATGAGRAALAGLLSHGGRLARRVLANEHRQRDVVEAKDCLRRSGVAEHWNGPSREATLAAALWDAVDRLVDDAESDRHRADRRHSADQVLRCIADVTAELPALRPQRLDPLATAKSSEDPSGVQDEAPRKHRRTSEEPEVAPEAKKAKSTELPEPKMPVFASVEEEERFLGRTYLEELRGNIKKLLRVQEDETKFPTYLAGLRAALHKVDTAPRKEGILKQPGVADWVGQARKVVETEAKHSHLLPHLLAQLDGWVVTKELQGDGIKPVPPASVPLPLPTAMPPFWPPMMPAMPAYPPYPVPGYGGPGYLPLPMVPGYPPPYPYMGMGFAGPYWPPPAPPSHPA